VKSAWKVAGRTIVLDANVLLHENLSRLSWFRPAAHCGRHLPVLPQTVIANAAAQCGRFGCEATSRFCMLRFLSPTRANGVLIMTCFWFIVLVERHRVVAPPASRLWAVAVPAL
jgi:hypothetical protein